MSEILTLAAQTSELPLDRAISGPKEPRAAARRRNRSARTELRALKHLGDHRLVWSDGRLALREDASPAESMSWQDLYWAIEPSDGALWQDVQSFMAKTGVAVPHLANTTDDDSIGVATRAFLAGAEVIRDAIELTAAAVPWLDTMPTHGREAKLRRILTEISRAAYGNSQLVVGRNSRLSWVYVALGWFAVDDELRAGVVLMTDPAKRGLREALLETAACAAMDPRWATNERGWMPVVRFATQDEGAADGQWMSERILELRQAGLLEPLSRWGRHPDHVWPSTSSAQPALPAEVLSVEPID